MDKRAFNICTKMYGDEANHIQWLYKYIQWLLSVL